jgi:folate-binding protein YgfZ
MADVNFAASPAATEIAAFLISPDHSGAVAVYRGVLTPAELDARTEEIEALLRGAAVHDSGWLRRISVRGEDRFRWLSGMVTNMVKDLGPAAGAWNLVLNAQGRIQGDLTVWRESDELELEVTADQAEKLVPHLDKFIIMDDVELAPVQGETAIGLAGPQAGEVLARVGLPRPEVMLQARAEWNGVPVLVRRGYEVLAEHYTMWIETRRAEELWRALVGAGARQVGSAAVEALRIAEGIPAYGVDMLERDLPQETSQLRALHFDKGCYIGQEIVERIRSRGNVHRHLHTLDLDGPPAEPGVKLMLQGTEAGQITSTAELPLRSGVRRAALAMIRAETESGEASFTYDTPSGTGSARILRHPATLRDGVER